jgi:DNA topoisomerase-1
LVVEREREIENFVSEEYWSIAAELSPDDPKKAFIANLIKIGGKSPKLGSEEDVKPILEDMEKARYEVSKVKIGKRKRKPSAPFTTSTMQQSASRRLKFTSRKTMRIAQQLYEGVDVSGRGETGLITYMRTDSTHVSKLAINEARDYIFQNHGKGFLPSQPRSFKTRTQGAQEAHEAIRPTSVMRTPISIKAYLTRDQYRLYQLIWQRFVASQMAPAVYDTISIDVMGRTEQEEYLLRATGSTIRFVGFLAVYKDPKTQEDKEKPKTPPIPVDLKTRQLLALVRLIPEQHFTQPPPRFSDASLVRELEENGIGRPSTYAPILSTLQNRGYIIRDGRRLLPTKTGFIVNDLVTEYFPEIVDVGFTANMEKELDQVASGEQSWVEIVDEFYGPFSKQVERAEVAMPEIKAEPEKIDRSCPKCGNDLIIRFGRHGKFIGCSTFPNCRYTEPWLEKIGVRCPEDGGDIVERKTRKGRTFYGCSNYPGCDFTSWRQPLKKPCPSCGGMLVAVNRQDAVCIRCDERFSRAVITSSDRDPSA